MVIWLRNGVEKSWSSISVCLLCISQKRVLSGFVVLFLLLTVYLFNVSFKTPFLNPIFKGFNSFSSNFSYISNATDAKLVSSLDFMQNGETPQANVSDIIKNGTFVGDSRNRGDFKDALLRNSSGLVKDGKNGGDFEDALVRNSSDLVKDVSDSRIGGDFEDALLRNSSDIVKDVTDRRNAGDFEDAILRNSSDLVKDVSDSTIGGVFDDALLRNSSDLVKGENFVADRNVTVEKSIERKFEEEKGNGSLVGESVGSGDDLSFGNGTSFSSSGDKIDNLLVNGEISALLPSPEVKSPVVFVEKVSATTKHSQIAEMQKTSLEKCDIFDGRWVRDDTKPYYPAGSCPHIDTVFDCYLNKRPGSEFVKWTWQPNGCDIPSLNATDFLERLRGKKLVFVGDSLNRNMWESLVCILRHSVKDKKRIHEKRVRELPGGKGFKNQGFHSFRFEDYDCTVDFVTSRFLVRESSFEGKNGSLETLRLDLMDQGTSMYSNADYLIFNTGHWWSHDKTSKRQNYYQEGNFVHTSLKVHDAYRKALRTWARWVDKNIESKKTQVIFRGYSATHFKGGNWNTGGQCHQETEPSIHSIHLIKYRSKMRALEGVIQDMKTPVIYLNITKLTDYRKDAHPSIYRTEQTVVHSAVHSEDCSHWCLPGVPDSWNELLYASLLKTGTGSWNA